MAGSFALQPSLVGRSEPSAIGASRPGPALGDRQLWRHSIEAGRRQIVQEASYFFHPPVILEPLVRIYVMTMDVQRLIRNLRKLKVRPWTGTRYTSISRRVCTTISATDWDKSAR